MSRKSNFCDFDSYIRTCYAVGNKYFVMAEQFFRSALSLLSLALEEMKNCSRITKYLVPTYFREGAVAGINSLWYVGGVRGAYSMLRKFFDGLIVS